MPTSNDDGSSRIAREAAAHDEGSVTDACYRWVVRAWHVVDGPNTRRAEELFRTLMRAGVQGSAVMEVGCGPGEFTAELHKMGARSVYGFDVSSRQIDIARAKFGQLPGVTFAVHSAESDVQGTFDLIVGRAILHHVDLRSVVTDLFYRNLAPGGRMMFMEPLGHPLNVLFRRLVQSAHTPDEWPLTSEDVRWLQNRFRARVRPVNLVSFPAGAMSSLLFNSADNALMRTADRIDQALELRPRLASYGRQGIIVIDRPVTVRDDAGAEVVVPRS